MEEFRIDLKKFLGLAMPNQYSQTVRKYISSWFGVILGLKSPNLHAPRLSFEEIQFTLLGIKLHHAWRIMKEATARLLILKQSIIRLDFILCQKTAVAENHICLLINGMAAQIFRHISGTLAWLIKENTVQNYQHKKDYKSNRNRAGTEYANRNNQ